VAGDLALTEAPAASGSAVVVRLPPPRAANAALAAEPARVELPPPLEEEVEEGEDPETGPEQG
jgi:hypothetical protein